VISRFRRLDRLREAGFDVATGVGNTGAVGLLLLEPIRQPHSAPPTPVRRW
jgi:hypothetical protein